MYDDQGAFIDKQSDVIESAAELLNRLAHSSRSMDTEQAVVLASAVLAVAVEVRRLTNAVQDGLLQQLVQLDADNAALIHGNGKTQPAAVLAAKLEALP